MLAIPPVKCITPLDDVSGLVNCLVSQNFCPEQTVRNDVSSLQQLRSSAAAVTEPTESGQQILLRYCHQVRNFAPRFVGMESQIKLNLTWNDAFGINMRGTSQSFYFDLACCLWNLAAFDSLAGARMDRTSEEGLRSASKCFQQAAGYLEYIKANVIPAMQPVSSFPCLSEDGLSMVKNLMLAQAQLCFYEKAVKDKKKDLMKSSIIAKLAKQTSSYYNATSVACKVGTLGTMLDISWFAVTDFQAKVFAAAAEYWQAQASKEVALSAGTGYGEEVARYQRADTLVGIALAQTGKFAIAESLLYGAQGLKQAIVQHKENAERDLRTVYMESVPSDYSLAEVGMVAMVKPILVPELSEGSMLQSVTLLFRYVLPQHIRQANAKYVDELNATCLGLSASADAATNAARAALSAKGLPGSLEAAKVEEVLPPSLWAKVQRVQTMGGTARLNSMADDLKTVARRALQTMAQIDESLDREEKVDEEFRVLHPHWMGTASKTLTVDVRTNNKRMREAYSNAQVNDKQTEQDMASEETQQQLKIVAMSREELIKLFPKAEVSLLDYDEGLDKQVEMPELVKLEGKLHELAALIEAREKTVQSLKALAATDITEITNQTIAVGGDMTALHEKNLNDAMEMQTQVVSGISMQEQLLQEIMQLNDDFERSRVTNPMAIERNKVIQNIEQSIAKFSSLHSQFTQGVTFYTSLQSKVTTLLQSADDLSYTQQWQRQDYLSQKSQEVSRSTQETSDRDYALKLSNEFAAASLQHPPAPAPNNQPGLYGNAPSYGASPVYSPVSANSNVPASSTAAGAYGAPPTIVGAGNGNNMVYGTPVAGPPANLVPAPRPNVVSPPPAQFAPAPNPYAPPPQQQQNPYGAQYQQYPAVPQSHAGGAYPPPPTYQQQPQPNYYPVIPGANPPPPYQPQYPGQQPYPAGPSMASQGAPAQSPPPPISPAELHAKTVRLCEMGFQQQQVYQALMSNNGDEEAALNALLSGPAPGDLSLQNPNQVPPAAGTPPAAAPTGEHPPGEGKKASGLFGKLWGHKSKD